MTGVWYSICWQPRDYANPNSFIELDGCPRFWFSEDGSIAFKSDLESSYPNLIVKEIFKTVIFTESDKGDMMPTHYRSGPKGFMPGDNVAYDIWLQKSFEINSHVLEKIKARTELLQKNMFLEYSSQIIRHDMHSGINTYLPRGLKMLLSKLDEKTIKENKLTGAITLLEKGLKHTQNVYRGVYAFTNLVKEHSQLDCTEFDFGQAITAHLKLTAYLTNVEVSDDLPVINGNESLVCTAVDNLIRNGLKYNDNSPKKKMVKLYLYEPGIIAVEDNGRGIDQRRFDELCLPYQRGDNPHQLGSGLGLNIATAIFKEHDFDLKVEQLEKGTRILIKVGGK